MPRLARVVAPGVPHHVTQRGNNRQDVFFVDDDRSAYLDMLAEQAERFELRVLGRFRRARSGTACACMGARVAARPGLMTNHVHLVVVPEREESLGRAVGRTHWRYTQAVNGLHGRSGSAVWRNGA